MNHPRLQRLRELCPDDATFDEIQQLIADEIQAQVRQQVNTAPVFDVSSFVNSRMLILQLDAAGRIEYINQAGAHLLGYKPADLIGADWFDTCVPEGEDDELRESYRRILSGGQPVAAYYENPVQRADGTIRLLAWHNILISDPVTGAIRGTFSTAEDITKMRQMEEQLHQRAIRYRQMFETNRAIKLLINPHNGRIVDANRAAVEFYGYPHEMLLTMSMREIVLRDTQQMAQRIEQVLQSGSAFHRMQHRLASGAVRDVDVYVSLLDGENKKSPTLYAIIFDVTESKRAQRALAASETLLRAATDHFPSGSIILFDREMRYLLARGQRMIDQGIDPASLEGQLIENTVSDEIAEYTLPHYRNALQGKSYRHEFVYQGRSYLSQIEPVRDDHGEIIAGLHVFQDMTDLQQAQVALKSKSIQLEAIMEGIEDAMTVIAPDGRIIYMNTSARQLISDDETIGDVREIFSRVPTYDEDGHQLAAHELPVARALNGEMVEPQTLMVNWPTTADTIWVMTRAKPVFDDDGNLLFVVTISSDITRLKENERYRLAFAGEQARTEALRGFITNTAHDLFTPLSVLGTTLYLLKRSDLTPQQESRVQVLERQTRRLQSVIQDMFTMLKLDTVRDISTKPTNLHNLIREVVEDSKSLSEQKQHTLHVETGEVAPIVMVNEGNIYKALHNLVTNAITYTPEQGKITIRCYRNEHEATIEVQDNGIGIPAADLPHIFDRFYRVDKARSTDVLVGSGLGLAIARKIVELHHGHISVDSEVGVGSIFRISLPL